MTIRLGPGREFDLIRSFFRDGESRVPGVVVGPGDDCAVVAGDGIALTADLSIEGVHFRRDWMEPRAIGYRAATASLSDLAAMAARPIGVLVSLALSEAAVRDDVGIAIMRGVADAVEAVGATVLGGDLARSPDAIVIDVVGVGEAPRPIRRSGAEPDDEIWVTGELGGAAAAVRALEHRRQPDPAALLCLTHPTARVHEAAWLAERSLLKAMIDLSDGLGGDLSHIAESSGVAVVLDASAIPLHAAVQRMAGGSEERLRLGLSGGEDYELCFAAEPGGIDAAREEFEASQGVRLTRVGVIERGSGVYLRTEDGERRPIPRGGFQHFGGRA